MQAVRDVKSAAKNNSAQSKSSNRLIRFLRDFCIVPITKIPHFFSSVLYFIRRFFETIIDPTGGPQARQYGERNRNPITRPRISRMNIPRPMGGGC